ncbi:MAG: insulinase family protein [Bacillota bacterium]|nr:insulinase family protein [Bacillota bacterium]
MRGTFFPLPGRLALRFSIHYLLPLEEVPPQGLLLWPRMMMRGCSSFPSRRHVQGRLDELEGASLWPAIRWWRHLAAVGLEGEGVPGFGGDRFLHLLRCMLEEPLFQPGSLEEEKRHVLRDLAGLRDDKEAYLWYRVREKMARGEPWGLPLEEASRLVQATSRADLEDFHGRLLREGRLFVVVAGEGAEPFFASLSGALPRGKDAPLPVLDPLPLDVEPQELTEEGDGEEGRVVMVYRSGASWGSREGYLLKLLHHLLGSSPSSRLFQAVREEKGWSYAVGSRLDAALGTLSLEATVEKERLLQVEDIMVKELEALLRGRIAEEAWASAVSLRRDELRYEREDLAALLEEALLAFVSGNAYRPQEEEETLAQVRPEEVVTLAARLRLDTLYRLLPGRARP